jgi:hypothetical protein
MDKNGGNPEAEVAKYEKIQRGRFKQAFSFAIMLSGAGSQKLSSGCPVP